MGGYSVPEHIRAMKPKGTMAKAIGGRYYAYEYRSITRGGRRKTEMGACVGKMFIADAGLCSRVNVEAFASDGCSYIIPLHKRLLAYREAVADPAVDGRFAYRRNRKASAVEYRDARRGGARVILFRDLNKQAAEQAGYLAKLEQGTKGYTAGRFEEVKDLMGVIVLQTSRDDLPAQDVYEAYKRRWSVETFFGWLKNGAGFTSPGAQDYCKAQGLAFVALVTALVHRGLADACKAVKGKSVDDCLLEARMVKANKVAANGFAATSIPSRGSCSRRSTHR